MGSVLPGFVLVLEMGSDFGLNRIGFRVVSHWRHTTRYVLDCREPRRSRHSFAQRQTASNGCFCGRAVEFQDPKARDRKHDDAPFRRVRCSASGRKNRFRFDQDRHVHMLLRVVEAFGVIAPA